MDPNLLTAVWVGNNDGTPMGKLVSGVSGAAPIWKKIMVYKLPKLSKVDFSIPEKIVSLEVDNVSGYPSHDSFASRSEYFIDGSQMTISDPIHLKLKVCKDQFGLATPDDASNNNYDEKEFFSFKEDDLVSTDGRNRWQEGIDGWINQQSDKDKYNPPTDYCRSGGRVNVGIDSPAHKSTVNNTFDVKITTNSLVKITEVKLWVDGVEKKIWTERPFEMSLTLEDGPHTIKVKAIDRDDNSQEREVKIGVNIPWDGTITPTLIPTILIPTLTSIPTIIPTTTVTLAPTPTVGATSP